MLVITDVVDELRSYSVPDENINRIIKSLLYAGQKSVYAAIGECIGAHEISPAHLGLIIGTLMAMPKMDHLQSVQEVHDVILVR